MSVIRETTTTRKTVATTASTLWNRCVPIIASLLWIYAQPSLLRSMTSIKLESEHIIPEKYHWTKGTWAVSSNCSEFQLAERVDNPIFNVSSYNRSQNIQISAWAIYLNWVKNHLRAKIMNNPLWSRYRVYKDSSVLLEWCKKQFKKEICEKCDLFTSPRND